MQPAGVATVPQRVLLLAAHAMHAPVPGLSQYLPTRQKASLGQAVHAPAAQAGVVLLHAGRQPAGVVGVPQ